VKRLFLWGPACAYMAVIYYASSVPGDQLPGHFWDKLAHLLEYSVLGILFLVPLADGRLSRATISAGAKAVVLSTLYGVFDEVHQAFTPERTPDARDLLADALGAALGVAAILLLRAAVTRMLAARRNPEP
jgi:VanZ family protein